MLSITIHTRSFKHTGVFPKKKKKDILRSLEHRQDILWKPQDIKTEYFIPYSVVEFVTFTDIEEEEKEFA